MKKVTGKTYSIINRLPHFLQSGGSENLTKLVSIFSGRLEKAELDLYRVIKSHYMETASNEGSGGYTALNENRGDLDKLFAMFLEALGGTSCFTALNPELTARLTNVRELAKTILNSDEPVIEYILQYLDPDVIMLLEHYNAGNIIFTANEIKPWFAQGILLGKNSKNELSPVSEYIKEKIINDPDTGPVFKRYGGGDTVSIEFALIISEFLNEVILKDLSMFINLFDYFKEFGFLSNHTWDLAISIYPDFLREYFNTLPDREKVIRIIEGTDGDPDIEVEVFEDNIYRTSFLNRIDRSEPARCPLGDDITRLNRMLLDTEYAFNSTLNIGFIPKPVPSLTEVQETLLDNLNNILTIQDLFKKDQFPDLHEDFDFLETRFKDKPEWLNRILFENIFPKHIEKSYLPYRQRMTGLIKALSEGASTKEGIVNIVANNLGIVGCDPESLYAKSLIKIKEFSPVEKRFYNGQLTFYQQFFVRNDNPEPQIPEIVVTILDNIDYVLSEVKLTNKDNGKIIVINDLDIIKPGHRIVIRDNGIYVGEVKREECIIPDIKPGDSKWTLETRVFDEAEINRPAGQFDAVCVFDDACFVEDEPIIEVVMLSVEYSPGVFYIEMPWHIPGFTDLFKESPGHPRHFIQGLVDKVKAAGVQAIVAYKQEFAEDHRITDGMVLMVHGSEELLDKYLLSDKLNVEEEFSIDSRQSAHEKHNINDKFEPAGRFDYTSFDSLNTFK